MNIFNSAPRFKKPWHFFSLFLIFSLALLITLTEPNKAYAKAQKQPSPPLLSFTNIEENLDATSDPETGVVSTGWGVWQEIIGGGDLLGAASSVSEPALDGSAIQCAITGGNAYNNLYCNKTLAKLHKEEAWPYSNVTSMIYSLDFYVDGIVDCSTPDNSEVQGIEFVFQHVLPPDRHEFAVQWSKSGEWRYWNGDPSVATWVSFDPPITSCINSGQWHNIEVEGRMDGDLVEYLYLSFNGLLYDISQTSAPKATTPDEWVENFIQVAVQIDGNLGLERTIEENGFNSVDPYEVYLDNVALLGMMDAAEAAVELLYFFPTADDDGTELAWKTTSEIDNTGFNIYRGESSSGPWTKFNFSLIPARGGATGETRYTLIDSISDEWYLLEDVDIYGTKTRHPPVTFAEETTTLVPPPQPDEHKLFLPLN